MRYKKFWLWLGILLILGVLAGQGAGNLERYAYKYIILLYEKGYNDILQREIDAFYAQYPESEFRPYLNFISANQHFYLGEYDAALKLYNSLLDKDFEPEIKEELYLNRAQALYHLSDLSLAMLQLQELERITADPQVLADLNISKARIYMDLKQSFSAGRAYETALSIRQSEGLYYEYLMALLLQNKHTQACEVAELLAEDEFYHEKALIAIGEYYLNSSMQGDFEELLKRYPKLKQKVPMQVLILRKAVMEADYERIERVLESASEADPYLEYYRALLAKQQGRLAEADAIFATLVKEKTPQVQVFSYLERLKILYKSEPVMAILQLGEYIANENNIIAKGEQYLTMGFFAYQKEDYPEALKQFFLARAEFDSKNKLAETDILIAKSWLKAKKTKEAKEAFKRYLNLYPVGKDRDAALFYLAFIHFEAKDYALATSSFRQIEALYPASLYLPPARFYMAEIDYYLANYQLSLDAFLEIMDAEPENSEAALRVAQIYYYMEDYEASALWAEKLSPSYESLTLQGHLSFIAKDYTSALQYFMLAQRASEDPLKITEATSYRALCLFQLKRYNEATEVYLTLFKGGSQSADSYLYLGAKSAYQAGDYHRAIQLFDEFVELYPQSQYFLPVLADIANSFYNLGNYPQAVKDYQNILIRYRNAREFSEADRRILGDVFTGLELALKRANSHDLIQDVVDLSETFQSLYITFELSYIILNIYAEAEDWEALLSSAEELRRSFPEIKRNEIELLMAESLVQLNEYSRADSLLEALYSDTQDLGALSRWAEIDYLSGNYAAAIQKYRQAYENSEEAELWYNTLKASTQADYLDFAGLWALGESHKNEIPASLLLELKYLVHSGFYEQASHAADMIINESLSPYDHAVAFLHKGLILYERGIYELAALEFNRCLFLFQDFEEIQDEALYYQILSYLKQGERDEAELQIWEMGHILSDKHREELIRLLEEER